MKAPKIDDGAWYLFLLLFFTPSLVMSFSTGDLTVTETLDYVYSSIESMCGSWIAKVVYIPFGLLTSLLPNDSFCVYIFFKMCFGGGATFMFFLFVFTTYPPKFLQKN
jgi:hypothetical protein